VREDKVNYWVLAVLTVFSLAGCATPASNLSKISVGMPKADVIGVMGPPTGVSADADSEYLQYNLNDNPGMPGTSSQYFVRLVNGKVNSYGRVGNSSTPQPPVYIPPPAVYIRR
jgi:hypothetical protein